MKPQLYTLTPWQLAGCMAAIDITLARTTSAPVRQHMRQLKSELEALKPKEVKPA